MAINFLSYPTVTVNIETNSLQRQHLFPPTLIVGAFVNVLHISFIPGDVLEFYQTPVDRLTPLEHLKASNLPPNLDIQLEAKRFDPGATKF